MKYKNAWNRLSWNYIRNVKICFLGFRSTVHHLDFETLLLFPLNQFMIFDVSCLSKGPFCSVCPSRTKDSFYKQGQKKRKKPIDLIDHFIETEKDFFFFLCPIMKYISNLLQNIIQYVKGWIISQVSCCVSQQDCIDWIPLEKLTSRLENQEGGWQLRNPEDFITSRSGKKKKFSICKWYCW